MYHQLPMLGTVDFQVTSTELSICTHSENRGVSYAICDGPVKGKDCHNTLNQKVIGYLVTDFGSLQNGACQADATVVQLAEALRNSIQEVIDDGKAFGIDTTTAEASLKQLNDLGATTPVKRDCCR